MLPPYQLSIYSISFAAFFVLLVAGNKYGSNRLLNENGTVSNRAILLLLDAGGILLLGTACFYFLDLRMPQLIFGKSAPSYLTIAVTGLLAAAALFLAPAAAKKRYGHLFGRVTGIHFTNAFISSYFLFRLVFLAIYETWFRGYLLTDCISSMGIPVAIAINIVLYSLLHIINGKKELYGCIPLGLVFCSLSIWANAAWPAIVLHLVIALSHEIYLVKRINKPSIAFV